MSRLKKRLSFSKAMDSHPSLKGKQRNLPDLIQHKIITSRAMRKKASHDPHYGVVGGQEGRMAKRQLHEIQQMAQELYCCLDDGQDLHEWVQIKLATIHDRLQTVHSYMMYEKEYPRVSPSILGSHV